MQIDIKALPTRIEQPIYFKDGIEIRMTVATDDGEVIFTAYVNGKYVPFSKDSKLFATVRVLNHELSMRGVK